MSEAEIPSEIRCLRLKDLNELIKDQSLTHGLWEAMPDASHLSDKINDESRSQRETAERIILIKDSIETLSDELENLLRIEKDCAAKWFSVEAEMHRKIEPYSRVGISKLIGKEIEESHKTSKICEAKLLDSDSGLEDPVVLAKRYVLAKQQTIYNQRLLDAL